MIERKGRMVNSSGFVRRIPLECIRVASWLPQRSDLGDLASLARSLRQRGDVDVPIKVRPIDDVFYEIVWGRRRFEAAKLAGLREITCIVEELEDEDMIRQNMIENLLRKDKNPLEEAEFFEFWRRRTGRSYEEIAGILGISPKYIYNRLQLLGLSEEVKQRIREVSIDRKISLLPLLYLHKIKDPLMQKHVFDEFVENNWTAEELRKRIEQLMSSGYANNYMRPREPRSFYYDLTIPLMPDQLSHTQIANLRDIPEKPLKVFTHYDTPSLFFEDGKTIDKYPLEWFIGKCVVVDVRCKSPDDIITVEHVKEPLDRHYLPTGIMVFLYTGWSKYRETEKYYEHPVIDLELAKWFVEKRTRILGVDMPNPERGSKEVHKLLLSHDILILENLADMEPVAGKKVMAYALPLSIKHGDVAPARVLVRLRTRRKVTQESETKPYNYAEKEQLLTG